MNGKQLSGHELRRQMQWREDADRIGALPQRGGLKDYCPDGSWLQEQKLGNFHDERREILLEERVQKQGCLAVGQWIEDTGKVLIIKNTGKFWKNFGHTENGGQQWLFSEEALFLMDEGSLEVYFGGVPLSLQKAYTVLLGRTVPVQHYQVFAHLCRFGYIVRRHSDKVMLTRYEQAVGLVKQTTSCCADERSEKRKLPDSIQDEPGVGDDLNERESKIPKISIETNSCKSLTVTETETVHLHGETLTQLEFRGWFGNKWFHISEHCENLPNLKLGVPSVTDKTCLGLQDILSRQTSAERSSCGQSSIKHIAVDSSSELSSLSLVAKEWASLKRSQQDPLVEDPEWYLSSPAGVLWSGDVKPLVHPVDATSYASLLKVLQIIENVDCVTHRPKTTELLNGAFHIIYDVYQPDSKFRKSDPGLPSVCLCVARLNDPMPSLADVMRLSSRCPDGAALMWSVVDSGDVSFYSFNQVNLPPDTDFTPST